LYVANWGNNTITVYDTGGTTAVETISKNLNYPSKIKFSKTGSLYVLNCFDCGYQDSGNVTVYGARTGSFLRTITDGLDGPSDIALDAAGNLYVANGIGNTVTVYPPGGTKATRTITRGIAQPRSLAIDSSDRIYVANCPDSCRDDSGGTVTVYDGHTGDLLETISDLEDVGPVLIGPGGDLYAVVYGGSDSEPSYVGVFPWGSLKPVRKMSSGLLGLALTVDVAGDTYVAECGFECLYSYEYNTGVVQEYGPKGYPIREITRKHDIAIALAIGADGNLYASYEGNEVLGYMPGSKKPSIVITSGISVPMDVSAGP
jgi:sugar lactone lactonase YvrE